MNRKYPRHKCAAPQAPRHLSQCQKQKHRCRRVKRHVGQMMAARPQAINLAVRHVRQPRQRMPVTDASIGQRPSGSVQGQTLCHHRVLIHIQTVIVINELETRRLPEHGQHRQNENNANGRHLSGLWFWPFRCRCRVHWIQINVFVQGYGTASLPGRVSSPIVVARPAWYWIAPRPDAKRAARFPTLRKTVQSRPRRRRGCQE